MSSHLSLLKYNLKACKTINQLASNKYFLLEKETIHDPTSVQQCYLVSFSNTKSHSEIQEVCEKLVLSHFSAKSFPLKQNITLQYPFPHFYNQAKISKAHYHPSQQNTVNCLCITEVSWLLSCKSSLYTH